MESTKVEEVKAKKPTPVWVKTVKQVCDDKKIKYTIPKKGSELHEECMRRMKK